MAAWAAARRAMGTRKGEHGVNPFEYLNDLFTRLPGARITQIKDFTPAAWAKAEKVAARAA